MFIAVQPVLKSHGNASYPPSLPPTLQDAANSASFLDANPRRPLTPCNSIEPSQIDGATLARIQSTPLDINQLSDRIQQLEAFGEEKDEEWVLLRKL